MIRVVKEKNGCREVKVRVRFDVCCFLCGFVRWKGFSTRNGTRMTPRTQSRENRIYPSCPNMANESGTVSKGVFSFCLYSTKTVRDLTALISRIDEGRGHGSTTGWYSQLKTTEDSGRRRTWPTGNLMTGIGPPPPSASAWPGGEEESDRLYE
jgi:hypothetical protein